jgi:uncharacterized protein HemX
MTETRQHSESPAKGRVALGVGLLVCVSVGAYFLVKGLTPADLPPTGGAGFLDGVFHNKGVVLAARLLLVSAAVVLAVGGAFIVASTIRRMANREWLRKAGPFEIRDTAVSEVEGQLEQWRRTAKMGREELAEVTEQLREADAEIEQLQLEIDETQAPDWKSFDFDNEL